MNFPATVCVLAPYEAIAVRGQRGPIYIGALIYRVYLSAARAVRERDRLHARGFNLSNTTSNEGGLRRARHTRNWRDLTVRTPVEEGRAGDGEVGRTEMRTCCSRRCGSFKDNRALAPWS